MAERHHGEVSLNNTTALLNVRQEARRRSKGEVEKVPELFVKIT